MDLCDVVDVCGSRYWWLVAVDQHTDCTMIAPCSSHESEVVAKKNFQTQDSVGRTSERIGVRRRARPGSLRDFHGKTLCQELRCKPQLHILRGRGIELSKRIATIKEVAGKTILQHQGIGGEERYVNCELRGLPRAEPKG